MSPRERWAPVIPEPLPLQMLEAGTTRHKQRRDILALDALDDLDEDALAAILADMRFVTACKVRETLQNGSGKTRVQERVAGTLWAKPFVPPRSVPMAGVLEIRRVATHPAYRRPAEDWLFAQLRRAMAREDWTELILRSPLDQPAHPVALLAGRHGFRAADVVDGKMCWAWTAEEA